MVQQPNEYSRAAIRRLKETQPSRKKGGDLGKARDVMIEAVREAYDRGDPIAVLKGPGYDLRLRKAFHLEGIVNQSEACWVAKRLVGIGKIRMKVSDELFPVPDERVKVMRPKIIFLPPSLT